MDGATGLPVIAPTAVLEESTVDGLGRFRLFGDGRVSVLFEDATVLTMRKAFPTGGPFGASLAHLASTSAASWLMCDVVFPDGRTTTVRSTCPVGAEGYVHAAVQFKAWASKPLEVRVAEASRHKAEAAHVAKEIDRISRHLVATSAARPDAIRIGDPAAEGISRAKWGRHVAATAKAAEERREREGTSASWLGGRAQVAMELSKLERALHEPHGGARRDGGGAPASVALPVDIANALASVRTTPAAAATPPSRGERVHDEMSRIEQFLQRAH